MKATELRIGNYITSGVNGIFNKDLMNTGRVLEIGLIDKKFEQIYCECEESFEWFFKDNYFGIPLTEEWLFKFGLVNHPNDIPTYGKFFGDFDDDDYGYFFCVYQDLGGNFYAQIIGKKIILNSVHQLQNLYFALAGEELKQRGKNQ